MNITQPNQQWSEYVETNRRVSRTEKLDHILEKRLKAFMKARESRAFRIKAQS